ncbi:glycerol kinase GlpK [Acetobacter pasteurianus]|uniref:Glycerol kinase n=1 Tax=Acetobacter pasteurianus (strain NBRC 105184 / IFO 3283-01) TaxID=634452 RepID=C7JHE7_ACEP3|nr:glycerol kinase GlpK [Acetobacter pasteurianus]BAH99401.1 glycerol kinase (variant) [Acetobacter pasteurianus IFO 3283-01]BAI05500.1 glycerol kinase (variant) [Acetobacter pasteurianus IFO 3283-07]BAI17689.1 glycerol kinase (variant) [Acetobacter pasteurianus IFO 3283-01-42C]BAI20673.1 glycerol kinase (variant) [Acetobacter pasteurianus IFO 3283-12]
MSKQDCVLAIDQGTTSTRSIVFDRDAQELAAAREEFAQHYPKAGWVEQCPEDIWKDVVSTARAALEKSGAADRVAGIGITNQRETIVVWERATGKPIHRAIVWQDRRTANVCQKLRDEGAETLVRERTGLLIDPYFSATKLAWLLDNVPQARERAEKGELAFGTIDSFILWRLTGGKVHATDVTNASRTMLFDIHRQQWDEDLLRLFRVPAALLPEVKDSSCIYGETVPELFGRPIPIAGIAGDQQAAVVGQACFTPGMAKATYGTGCFLLLNTGDKPVTSRNRMLTTIAYRINGKTTYALEGSIFVAGAAIKWLRDGLHLITHASQTDDMATRVPDSHGVYMVPGFVGLGAPHWDPDARGLICGLTLDSSAAHIARAALESVAYQTLDLVTAMMQDGGGTTDSIRVDGGMSANDWYCQFLADMLQAKVERPRNVETTALGAGFLAGIATGVWDSEQTVASEWARGSLFEPKMENEQRRTMIAGWHQAVKRTLSTYTGG